MRKFLSILMLICLLWGMVLPAGAEGEGGGSTTAKLYAKTGSGEEYLESLTFVAGETLTARFYTSNAAESAAITSGTFTSDKTDLTMGAPGENGNCALSSDIAGDYTVSYELDGTTYSMTVTVTVSTTNTITVPNAATLSTILSDQAVFDDFLTANHYSKTGDLTLVLPTGPLGSITCSVQLDKGKLSLKGVSGTSMRGLIVNAENVSVDGISFTRSTGTDVSIMVNTASGVVVTDCSFSGSGYDFQLKQDTQKNAAVITMTGNSFLGNTVKAALRSATGSILGYWTVTTAAEPETVNLDLNARVEEKTDIYEIGYLELQIDQDIHGLVSQDWEFKFKTKCTYSDKKSYAAFNKTQFIGDEKSNILNNGYVNILVEDSGEYVLVNDTAPSISKGIVRISKSQALHLKQVTVSTTYNAASVTFGKKTIDSEMASIGTKRYLTFPVDSYGDYAIKETTKTVTKTTKTKTTSRKYTTYQDYFLVTPQGFSNAVRYVRDNLVTLNCTEAGTKAISLPVPSMAAAAEKGYSVLVKTKGAELTLDAAALKSLAQQAKGDTVLLHYKSLNHKTLTAVGQASVKSHLAQYPGDSADLAFLVTATSDSETIEDLQKGTITLKIPFIILPGAEGTDNMVYALQGEGLSEARDTTVADGYLTTKLLDLTEHMVFQVGEPVETTEEPTEATVETTEETTEEITEPDTGDYTEDFDFEQEEEEDGFPVWIPVAAVLLLAGGGAAA